MPRRPRSLLEDGFFHVTARGVAGSALFVDPTDRADFLAQLKLTAAGFLWVCHAYCLMTTHYHLLLETTQESLSRGMHRLNGLYAQGFNVRHGRKGHVFEERFSAYVIVDEGHLAAARQYILNNPVRAELCEFADDWPWSGTTLEDVAPALAPRRRRP